jgi:hypothetical protein
MSGAITLSLLVGFLAGRAYDEFAYSTSTPGFEGQKELAINALLDTSRKNNRDSYRRSLDRMKVSYMTLRDSFCVNFDPPSGNYWHSISVCFDKKTREPDIFRY